MLAPIRVVKAGYHHFSASATGCVYKMIAADEQADMGIAVSFGIEKDQIART
jgi:hypothetical protein